MDQTLIHYDPLGVVLIMGAWNYPLQLSLAPLAGIYTSIWYIDYLLFSR